MASTRTRLTVSYLVVVTAMLVAFAIALYVARGAEADQDVLEQAASLADDVLATIRNAQLAGKRLTYQEQTEGLPTDVANVAPHLLFGTLLTLAPVILILPLGVAYFVAGRAFRPVDELINEVEAITDGRSLHRRLPVPTSGDEMSRLSATLNAMIARLESSFTALRRFTADASHELKTPLTVL